MAGLSTAGAQTLLGSILNNSNISLHTADPGNTGTSELVAGTSPGYARQTAGFSIIGGAASNAAAITFTATGNWAGGANITHFGVWVTTQFQGSGALSAPKQINNGDSLRFLGSALTVTAQ